LSYGAIRPVRAVESAVVEQAATGAPRDRGQQLH